MSSNELNDSANGAFFVLSRRVCPAGKLEVSGILTKNSSGIGKFYYEINFFVGI